MSQQKSLPPEQARQEYAPFIGRNSFYAAIRRGEVPHIRLGRKILIPRSAMERWLENAGTRPQSAA